jgi:hypothetical protein
MSWRDQQQLQTTNPSSRQIGCYIRTITAIVQLENKIMGRESQGACDNTITEGILYKEEML